MMQASPVRPDRREGGDLPAGRMHADSGGPRQGNPEDNTPPGGDGEAGSRGAERAGLPFSRSGAGPAIPILAQFGFMMQDCRGLWLSAKEMRF